MRRAHVPWLAAIVGVSFAARTAVAWLHAVPALFPDEYIYASLGRSLASSGRPLIRGGSAHFPALLEPLLTAPAWLVGDVATGYRLVQAIGSLAMSLAAVPVYLLARRLGLSARIALALAALAVLVPDLVYTSFVTSEPFAYPLVLAAVAAATAAISRPTRRAQVAFVALAGLAAFARAEFAVLPVVFLAAVVALGFAEGRFRGALREQLLPLGLFLVPVAGIVLAGPMRLVGFYHGAFDLHPHPVRFLRWTGWDLMMLLYSSGWIVVPGALLGLWLALRRPASREERAFGAIVVLLALVLIVEVGVFQTSVGGEAGPQEVKERYLFYLVPLVSVCFALYARRGWPLRLQHLALAAALVVLSVRVPLSGFAVATTISASPFLFTVYWLTEKLDGPSNAATVVAAAVATLSALAVLASRRPRLGTPVVLALALLATGAASASAVAFDVGNTRLIKEQSLAADPSWVDAARVGRASLLQAFAGSQSSSLQQLFWNRSIDRVLLLPDAARFDTFRTARAGIGSDGTLLVGGHPVGEALVVDGYGSFIRLRGARMVEASPRAALWVPAGRPRLALYEAGRFYDGWLAGFGSVRLWPQAPARALAGWLTMRLTAPRGLRPLTLAFRPSSGARTSLRLRAGESRRLRLPVCSAGAWRASFRSTRVTFVGLRPVSVEATAPVFTPSAAACPNARGRTVSP